MKKNHFRSFAILFGLLVCGAACYGLLHLWQLPVEDSWIPAPYAPPLAQPADLARHTLLRPILALPAGQRTPEQLATVYQYFLDNVDPPTRELRARVDSLAAGVRVTAACGARTSFAL